MRRRRSPQFFPVSPLGFDLAPRIKDIKNQVLYKMDRNQHLSPS